MIHPHMGTRRQECISDILYLYENVQLNKRIDRKFFKRIEIVDDSLCWNWSGNFRQGLPNLWDKKSINARKLAFELCGKKRPESRVRIVPICENDYCVNPNHMVEK
jgi:hypothetical protein